MKTALKQFLPMAIVVATATALMAVSPTASAQTAAPPATASQLLTEPTIKALQEALNQQGIAVKVDGILNDETRAAVRKYQTQHHLPVTGEPDKATLAKLGVVTRQSEAPAAPPSQGRAQTTGQAPAGPGMAQAPMQPGQGGMMNCPMMQASMQGMMQMMQGMMQMMQMMQGQMMQGPMQQGPMQQGPMQPGQMGPAPR